ncbi:MAG: mRNA surveillance protein pelota, partial [Candidatus Jordarchaeaceae archaeon]
MKIIRWDLKHGIIVVLPEVLDDFWVLYNIIKKGDRVYMNTTREVKLEDRYERPEKGKRISVFLGISTENVEWDRHMNKLRVHGIICEAPEEIGLGSHHTLNVTLNKPLTIVKNVWMKYEIDQLKKSTEAKDPQLAVIVIDDEGYCFAIIRGFGYDVKAEENISIPGKQNVNEREKTLQKLFKSAAESVENFISDSGLSLVVLGVGLIKNQFVNFLKENKPELHKAIVEIKSVSSTGKSGLNEALRSGVLEKTVRNVRVAEEAKVVEEVLERLGKESTDIVYGLSDVEKANVI